VASGGEGRRNSRGRGKIEEAHPSLAEDLLEEITEHPDMRKEQMIAGVVLSQELLSSRISIPASCGF
jgi:hypothetical protein